MFPQKQSPFFSILLPIYNGEKYLRQSIASVLSQSFRDFELVIWNDGSSDSSAEIVAEYDDPRIRYYRNESNRGIFPTVNLAIQEARGAWIRLWTQDDLMKPSCLQAEVDFIGRHDEISMYTCTGDLINDEGEVVGFYRDQPRDPTPDVIPPKLAAIIMIYHGPLGGNICFFGIKKAVLEEIGYFREDMLCSGDFEMLARLSRNHLIGFIREPLVYLRGHKGQTSRRRDIHVASWAENKHLYDELFARLPPESRRHARFFYFFTYAPMRMHYLLARLVRRDFQNARKAYRTIRRDYGFTKDFLAWCLTGDRRLYRVRPKYRKG